MGIDDFEEKEGGKVRLILELSLLNETREALKTEEITNFGLGYFPKSRIKLTEKEKKLYNSLIEDLKDNLDVQEVFDNVI